MRSLGLLAVLGMVACGQTASTELEVQSAPVMTPEVAVSPNGPSRASGITFGIIYAGNMMGELEPCG